MDTRIVATVPFAALPFARGGGLPAGRSASRETLIVGTSSAGTRGPAALAIALPAARVAGRALWRRPPPTNRVRMSAPARP